MLHNLGNLCYTILVTCVTQWTCQYSLFPHTFNIFKGILLFQKLIIINDRKLYRSKEQLHISMVPNEIGAVVLGMCVYRMQAQYLPTLPKHVGRDCFLYNMFYWLLIVNGRDYICIYSKMGDLCPSFYPC